MTGVENYVADDIGSSVKTDELLCDLQRTANANMHESTVWTDNDARRVLQPPGPPNGGGGSGYSSSPLGTTAGIGLSGGLIYNALDGNNLDAVENEGDTLDVCSCHPAPQGDFHYHFWGACLVKDYGFWSNTESPALCRDTDNCVTE